MSVPDGVQSVGHLPATPTRLHRLSVYSPPHPSPVGVRMYVWIYSPCEFPVSSLTDEFNRSPPVPPYRHLSVLGSVMQGGPTPGVSHDGGSHQQQPVQDGCVAASSCKVEGCGPFVVPSCQADVSEGDLEKGGEGPGEAGWVTTPLGWPPGGGHGTLGSDLGGQGITPRKSWDKGGS